MSKADIEWVWLPLGVVDLAAVSPELKEVEGAYFVRADKVDEAVKAERERCCDLVCRACNNPLYKPAARDNHGRWGHYGANHRSWCYCDARAIKESNQNVR